MKTILFVCVHNSGRSQIAEAFFNRIATGKALALSAGTQPGDAVNPVVVEAMREVGFDLSNNKPKKLTVEMLQQAYKVITMGCMTEDACPATFVETEDWALQDPKGRPLTEVRKIRDEIKARVTKMVEELTSPSPSV